MNTRTAIIFCACVLTLKIVTPSPVLPELSLKQFSPTDVCLFMCNICFDDMGVEMIECANNVCMAKQKYEMNLGLVKLGRTCKNYRKLDQLMFGNETD